MNTLYDHHGHRKYLTPAERDAFLKAADGSEVREVRTFCAMLAHTGCRISEALTLTDRVDLRLRLFPQHPCAAPLSYKILCILFNTVFWQPCCSYAAGTLLGMDYVVSDITTGPYLARCLKA